MDVLVLGGTQLTGLHLVPDLLDRGHRVTMLTRGNKRPAFLSRVEHIVADRLADGLQAVAGRRFDAVVDNIAYEPAHIRQVADSLGDGAGRYVLTSTAFVVEPMETVLRPIREDDADLDQPPPGYPGDPHGRYIWGKRQCEAYLRSGAAPFPWTVLRPGAIVGASDPQFRLRWWVARILDGRPLLLPDDFPAGNGCRSNLNVWAGDVAAAQEACLTTPVAAGGTYFVAPEEAPSVVEWIAALAEAAGLPLPPLVSIPRRVANLTPLADNGARTYRVPLLWPGVRLDVSRAVRDPGWRPTPLAEWLPQVVIALLEAQEDGLPWPNELAYHQRPLEVWVAERWLAACRTTADRLTKELA